MTRPAAAQSVFTYQGRLTDAGAPVNGTLDLRFTLYNALEGGSVIGRVITNAATSVASGLFTTSLDFGAAVFDGGPRWLEVAVRPAGGGGFSALSPRQPVTPAPYARFALNGAPGPQGPPGVPWSVNGSSAYYNGGNVGLGTSAPQALLHGVASAPRWRLESTSPFLDGPFLELVNAGRSDSEYTGGGILFHDQGRVKTARVALERFPFFASLYMSGLRLYADTTAGPSVTLMESGAIVLHGSVATQGSMDVGGFVAASADSQTAAILNRNDNDGVVVSIRRDGVGRGSISVSGATVSYNAFTGSHFAWLTTPIQPGALVRMTGANRRLHESPAGEIVYGVESTQRANDAACLGAYQSLLNPAQEPGPANPHLVAAAGNGDLWVVGTGEDVRPGDSLIASDVAGCAMRDDPRRFAVGHIVARAVEAVDWSTVAPDAAGVKRRRISVLFDAAIRSGNPAVVAHEQRIQTLENELARLRAMLETRLGTDLVQQQYEP